MEIKKIIIYPKFKSFMSIGTICLGLFFLSGFFYFIIKVSLVLKEIIFLPDLPYLIIGTFFLLILLFLGLIFFFASLGKKITIYKNIVEYQNYFFFHSKIEITTDTKIKMGSCYPKWGGRPVGIWKISNHHGKEKIKIHSDFFDYEYVNSILEKLNGNKIEFSNALIKY